MNDATEMAGTVTTISDVSSLLSMELTELADLAEIKVPAVGRYGFSVATSTKEEGEHPQVIVEYTVMSVEELTNAEDTPPKTGDKFMVNYNIDNEFGLGKLKKDLKPYAEHFAEQNIGAILEAMEGCMIHGTVKQRLDKKNTDDEGKPRVYGTVVNVEIQ